eukprot:4615319-Alexandrium_andersonii.AAC.1
MGGLGHAPQQFSSVWFERCFTLVVAKILCTGYAPMVWHLAAACKIPKHNGKAACDGERIVVLLCAVGRCFYRMLMDKSRA